MEAPAKMQDESDAAAFGPEALLVRAKNGDRDAFGQLLEAQYDFIYRTAFKWCGNREDAEDVAQDVCIKLPRILKSFEGRSAFESWLYRVVLNAVRDMQRSGKRRSGKMQALDETALQVAEPATDEAAMDAELWAAVRRLPPRQADAVLLVYAEQKSHAEAAGILGCAESTLSWHVHEARKALKALLRDDDE